MRTPIQKNLIKLAPAAVLLLLALGGCGGKGHLIDTPETQPREAAEPISPIGYNHFVNANLLEIFGASDEALKEYEKALEYFPNSVTIRTDYARLLFRASRIPQALEQALQIYPKNADVYLLIGDCYRLQDQLESAVENYRHSIELDPENVNAYWYIAGYYRQTNQPDSVIAYYYHLARLLDTDRIWGELSSWLADAGRYEEAEKAMLTAIDLNPDSNANAGNWFDLGVMMGKAEKYDRALNAFQHSIRIDSTEANLGSYLGLATTYDLLDSLTQSEEVYRQAIALAPDDVRIYRQMLTMYLGREDLEKSIAVSEELVALVPSDWVAQRRLGILLYTDGQLERADSLFESRIEFGDDNAFNFFYRGRVAIEQERYNDAKQFLIDARNREPAFVDSWLNLGFVLAQQDSLGQAIEMYRDGLTYAADHEDSIRLTFALGAALERDDQFYEAVNTFKELISREKDHAPALNYLGYMLADRGEELQYALELINRAMELSPENGAYIDSYAWVQFRLGNFDLALTELKKAAELIDNDAVIFEHLGDVYKAMGDIDAAKENYERALELDPDSIIIEEKLKE
jgi:tetratricopeptide (TPR) repeat protein